jgi:predicted TIM-barrel fold metal-dependent hydrolase
MDCLYPVHPANPVNLVSPPPPFDSLPAPGNNGAMPILDAHTHILPPDLIAQREALAAREAWFGQLYADPRHTLATAEGLLAALAIAFGFAFADSGLCRACNDYTLDATRHYPGRILPFAVVNPTAGAAALAEAGRCLAEGALGLGELLPQGQGYSLDDGALDPLVRLAQEADAPVLLHINEPVGHAYPGKMDQGPAQAYALAVRHPGAKLILAHWGGGLPFYELMPEVRRALARVYYDTAASLFLYDDAIFRHVAQWAGHKILFGSDYPLIEPGRLLQRIARLGLPPNVAERILYGNAAALLAQP